MASLPDSSAAPGSGCQVVLNWAQQQDVSVIPASTDPTRQRLGWPLDFCGLMGLKQKKHNVCVCTHTHIIYICNYTCIYIYTY
jgi:hypothetical protein